MDRISKHRFWSIVNGSAKPTPRNNAGREILANLKPFKENPCIHIHLDQPNHDHTCQCGVVYPCDKYGQCVISIRNGRIRSCLFCNNYQPKPTISQIQVRRSGPMQWSVGVTTANRPQPDHRFMNLADQRAWSDRTHPINWTLRSIAAAGWDSPVVFSEPGCYRPLHGYAQWIERPAPFGSWKNWKGALHQLCHDRPSAEAILLIQDDVIFCRGLREFLESMLWPDNTGVISLYCSAKYANGGGLIAVDSGHGFWGACALLFHRDLAMQLVHDPVVESLHGNKIDIRVGRWCKKNRRNLYVFTPSLAQHIGEYRSSLGHGGGGGMSAKDFVGEEFDARTLIKRRHVAVAMPVFGCGDLAERAIEALAKFTDKSVVTLWLVDDAGPRDDWTRALTAAERSGLTLKVVTHESNLGFTPAVNRVIAESGRDDVLILNSDAYICNDVVGILSAHLDRNSKIGCIGPQEFRLDTRGPYNDIRLRDQYQGYWGRLPNDAEQVASELRRMVEFEPKRILSYFCTLIRREALDDVGPLDSRLASGLAADNLHCDRLREKGWLVGVAHDGLALHQGSASFKRAGLPKAKIQSEAKAEYRRILAGSV